jgi:hypothetical protein
MRRLKWIALAGTFVALAFAAPAAAGTLDQQQTATDGNLDYGGPDNYEAQTFTSGISGGLDQVDLILSVASAACDVTVDIRTVSAGIPTDTVLARQTILGSDLALTSGTFTRVGFSNPAPVVAGTQYAIVLTASTNVCGRIGDQSGNPYAGGNEVTVESAPPATEPNFDWAFRTYVQPPDTDAPETTITKDVKRSKSGKAKFRFTSNEAASTFECKLKGPDLKKKLKQFRDCDSPRKYKSLDEGRFKFKVRAIDAAGNVDPTPDKDSFRVID